MTEIGDNSRNMSPFEAASVDVDLVWTEAQHWLDGAKVQTQIEADAIGGLLDMARKAKAKADAARKVEARPFDDGKAEVQARYKPLLARCDVIADTAKAALQPFLAAQEAEKRRREAEARAEAERARQAAQAAFREAQSVAEREAAERAAEAAKSAEIAARMAANDKGHVKGGERAIGLRTRIVPQITDLSALLKWVWSNDQSALRGFAQTYVEGAFRAGQRNMDGVEAVEERSVA